MPAHLSSRNFLFIFMGAEHRSIGSTRTLAQLLVEAMREDRLALGEANEDTANCL